MASPQSEGPEVVQRAALSLNPAHATVELADGGALLGILKQFRRYKTQERASTSARGWDGFPRRDHAETIDREVGERIELLRQVSELSVVKRAGLTD
jgi:hypothetical protein